MGCHSVRYLRSPLLRSFQLSLVAVLVGQQRPVACLAHVVLPSGANASDIIRSNRSISPSSRSIRGM